MAKRPKKAKKQVETFLHEEASRTYIPTAEYEPIVDEDDKTPIQVAYERRNPDLDPQLVWRGKDVLDWSDLVVPAPPLYIQEKVHPKVLIDDLIRETEARTKGGEPEQFDFFDDFNGLPSDTAKTEFYEHEANWTNRMILGDSLQVMASLAEREGLRGKVQCIYVDPPYGIRFNSNFQWSTTSRNVRDGDVDQITREPEQVKAFRDTWRDGIHTYLTYLRDRLLVARDLLSPTGSLFVQIGDENVHRVRSVMEEVFGEENLIAQIAVVKTSSATSRFLAGTCDYLLWFARDLDSLKYHQVFREKEAGKTGAKLYNRVQSVDGGLVKLIPSGEDYGRDYPASEWHQVTSDNITSQSGGKTTRQSIHFQGDIFTPGSGGWKTNSEGMTRLIRASRVTTGGKSLRYIRRIGDFPVFPIANLWDDMLTGSFTEQKVYVVQTAEKLVERCLLMATDPGDLVIDPTCGSGTTAYVAEEWGRRWITIDTSRVALALARSRIMGARYLYYLLADSSDGQRKLAEIVRKTPRQAPSFGRIRQGFVYERAPHIMLSTVSNDVEIDVIWEHWQPNLQHALNDLNFALVGHPVPFEVETGARNGESIDFTAPEGQTQTLPSGESAPTNGFMEWEVPKEAPQEWPKSAKEALDSLLESRLGRQQEIDASIAAAADFEYLYDKPYEDNNKVRVAGPFTVESLAPHRTLVVSANEELIDLVEEVTEGSTFVEMILENLKVAGIQQAHKEDRISLTSLTPWPGTYVCAEGHYLESAKGAGPEKRAAIFIGPEFGTVSRPDLVAAAREAADAGFDTLVACAFSYDAQSTEFNKLGPVPILKARMNADLHMGGELKSTANGNLFVIFGEPDIDLLDTEDGKMQVKINGVDVFDPSTGEVRSDSADGIACWFIDTDYNEESFFVRQAYFLGANDPYQSLKTSLKAEVNREAWESLHSDTSRPFRKPDSGRIAVKVINHLGDEVMKVFRIE